MNGFLAPGSGFLGLGRGILAIGIYFLPSGDVVLVLGNDIIGISADILSPGRGFLVFNLHLLGIRDEARGIKIGLLALVNNVLEENIAGFSGCVKYFV